MSKYLWWIIAKRATAEMVAVVPTFVAAHAVPEAGDQTLTLCGFSVPQLGPDTAWRMRDDLGDWRPCDRIIAVHTDRGDQPDA